MRNTSSVLVLSLALGLGLCTTPVLAQGLVSPKPLTLAPMPALPEAKDIAFNGTMQVFVDATDTTHRVMKIKQSIPVQQAGDMLILVPKWLPGKHRVAMQLSKIAGIKTSVDGKPVAWKRDVVAVNGFHVDVPKGAKTVEVAYEFLAATEPRIGRVVMTNEIMNIQWDFASMYPAGYYVSRIPVQARIKYPKDWQAASALEVAQISADNIVTYKPTDYETLQDSPVFAGRYFKSWVISPPEDKRVVRLNVVADKPELLNASEESIAAHKALVVQTKKLFSSQHFDHYDFLVAATDYLGGIGLEHHRSSENSVDPKYLTDWKTKFVGRDLVAHEMTHSWNGKFRRGYDLWTPDFQTPMRDSFLWVYEGQTQFWGQVLATRSGLYTKDQALGLMAMTAATFDNLPGRQWRDLLDTTNDPIIASREPLSWRAYQRSEDYYSEGLLVWLDADSLIREKTAGKKSLDDFAKAFFGKEEGSWTPNLYDKSEVINTLNSVYAHDWAAFLDERLTGRGTNAPLDGIARGGYNLVYTETPTDYYKAVEVARKSSLLTYSIGATINATGVMLDVHWDGPLYRAGMIPGVQIIAVNGKSFDNEGLKEAIRNAATNKTPIELLVKREDQFQTIKLDYYGGLKYPRLQRNAAPKAWLDELLAPRS